jgi:GxxExxY protein
MPQGEKTQRQVVDALTEQIIAAAIEVHRALGPGLTESVYEQCLCRELALRGLRFRHQVAVPVEYKGVKLECERRVDVLVEEQVVLELKSVEAIDRVHQAQVLTYLRLGKWKVALIINFNVAVLKEGIRRIVQGLEE